MSVIEDGGTGIHATAVVYGESGVLIFGPSGSGKSALALALLARARDTAVFGALVGDDRVWAREVEGRLIASGSSKLAGLIERRSVGLVTAPTSLRPSSGCSSNSARAAARGRACPTSRMSWPSRGSDCRGSRSIPAGARWTRRSPWTNVWRLSRHPMRSEKEFRLNIAPQCTKMARFRAGDTPEV